MYYTFITRKQIGVIFANWKKGNLELDEKVVKFLYDHCAEVRGYKNNNSFEDVLARVKDAIEKIFSNEYKEAEEEIQQAYDLYNIIYQ